MVINDEKIAKEAFYSFMHVIKVFYKWPKKSVHLQNKREYTNYNDEHQVLYANMSTIDMYYTSLMYAYICEY